ncbi:unnamed protein product, partial [Cylicostephanus goldi]
MLTLFKNPHYAHVCEAHLSDVNSTDKDIWTFPAAVIYYNYNNSCHGNVCPASEWGRLLLVIYGMIGIPLALVTMAETGKFISRY